MCDYSLMGIPNRLAKEGEELVLYRFPSGTVGLTSLADFRTVTECLRPRGVWETLKRDFLQPVDLLCAVCIPPGSRLRLEGIPERLQGRLGVGQAEEVTFTQLSAEPGCHRDAVRFRNGNVVRIQDLRTGIWATVLDLSLAERLEPNVADVGAEVLRWIWWPEAGAIERRAGKTSGSVWTDEARGRHGDPLCERRDGGDLT